MSPYIIDIREASKANIPWMLFKGTSILIAGSTGLIGSCLVRIIMAADCGCTIYAMCRDLSRAEMLFQEYLGNKYFHILRNDVTNLSLDGTTFDYIIDAASSASPSIYSSDPISVIRGNIYGVDNLLSYGIKHGMKRFLYVSSGEIYGESDKQIFTEEDSGYVNCLSQRSCYPSSKRAAETLAAAYAFQFGAEVVIARPCHIYGPEFQDRDNRVYAEFLRKAVESKDIILKSDGTQLRSWCYVVDCSLALLYILLKGRNCEAYNIADQNSNMTIKELAEMIATFSKSKVIFEAPTDKEVAGFNPIRKSTFSNLKLRDLGWAPANSMKTSMEHCYIHLKSNMI